MKTYRETLKLLFVNWPTMFAFELIYKLITSTVLIPLGLWMISVSIHIAGYDYVSETNVLLYLVHPLTIAFAAISVFVLTAISLFDISAILYVTDASLQNKKVGLLSVWKFAFAQSRRVFSRGNGLMIVQMLLIIPFINIGGATGLLNFINIPEFGWHFVLRTPWLLILVITGICFVTWCSCKWLFSFHYFVLENCSFLEARIRSKKLHRGFMFRDFIIIILEQVVIIGVFVALVLLIVLVTMAISALISTQSWMFSLVMGIVITVCSVMLLLYMCLSVPITYTIISVLFYRHKQRLNEEIHFLSIDERMQPLPKRLIALMSGIAVLCVIVLSIICYMGFRGQINFNIEHQKTVEIAAHRGLAQEYPENTMEAFEAAMDLNAEWIELDVRMTKDGVPVVIHDASLKRVAGINRKVCDMTWDELKQVDVGSCLSPEFSEAHVPLLTEVIELAKSRSIRLIIELKPSGKEEHFAQSIVDIVNEYDFQNQCCLSADHYYLLEDVKAYDENIQTMRICTLAFGDLGRSTAADSFCVESTFVSNNLISEIHREGKEIFVWTPDNQQLISRFIHMGVDGIVTDEVVLAKTLAYNAKTSNILQDYIQALVDIFYRGVTIPQI